MPQDTDAQKALSIHSNNIFDDLKKIIQFGKDASYATVDNIMTATYWNIGRRIVEEEQNGEARAKYGSQLIERLSEELTHEFGKGFSKRYLAYFKKFYLTIPNYSILQTRLQNVCWSHVLTTLRVDDEIARRWYLEQASIEMWSVNTLDRNISTQYYERHYKQPSLENKETSTPCEILKTPMMAEFLGFKNDDYSETDLEASIIAHIKDFMMELGRGFAFMGNQQHIRTDQNDYYIDLVFYNVVLKCYVLIDKKSPIKI